jgi:uncharacterized protein (DUF488 family)
MPVSRVYTIGHSTRSADDFVALLRAHAVDRLADVRTIPQSRRNPQFGRDALQARLAAEGIGYRHFPELGGLRRPRRDSPNTGWQNASFQGYADYMLTAAFASAVDELLVFAAASTAAVMCAEAVWWRCHRRLLSDALVARGVEVGHITGETRVEWHRLTAFARAAGGHLVYPGDTSG